MIALHSPMSDMLHQHRRQAHAASLLGGQPDSKHAGSISLCQLAGWIRRRQSTVFVLNPDQRATWEMVACCAKPPYHRSNFHQTVIADSPVHRRAAAVNRGRLLFDYFFLATQEKVVCCRATPDGFRPITSQRYFCNQPLVQCAALIAPYPRSPCQPIIEPTTPTPPTSHPL